MLLGKKPTHLIREHIESVELNITPFIDIMVCLILFLLSSVAIMKLAVLDTTLPRLASGGPTQVDAYEEHKVMVTLQIVQSGFRIGRVGRDQNAARQKDWETGGRFAGRLAKNAKGEFDYEKLQILLKEIKRQYPASDSMLILPAPEIPFDVVVQTMDVSRESREGVLRLMLFPKPTLGHLSEAKGGK